jgi:hypothetical protein
MMADVVTADPSAERNPGGNDLRWVPPKGVGAAMVAVRVHDARQVAGNLDGFACAEGMVRDILAVRSKARAR